MSIIRAKHGARWTGDEDGLLRTRCETGHFLEDIAQDLGRSIESVRTRANVLGIACRPGRKAAPRAPRPARAARKIAASTHRLICLDAHGSTVKIQPLKEASDAAAIAAAKRCASPGGCEAWRTGEDLEMLGRY